MKKDWKERLIKGLIEALIAFITAFTVSSCTIMKKDLNKIDMMNGAESVRFIVVHCSATRADRDYTVEQLLRDHKARGFRTIGYHFYIRKDGTVTQHRKLLEVGAHAKGYNRCSIGICYEGGLNECGVPADTRTPEQKAALQDLLVNLKKLFPHALICGHRDLPGVNKSCPCFDVKQLSI